MIKMIFQCFNLQFHFYTRSDMLEFAQNLLTTQFKALFVPHTFSEIGIADQGIREEADTRYVKTYGAFDRLSIDLGNLSLLNSIYRKALPTEKLDSDLGLTTSHLPSCIEVFNQRLRQSESLYWFRFHLLGNVVLSSAEDSQGYFRQYSVQENKIEYWPLIEVFISSGAPGHEIPTVVIDLSYDLLFGKIGLGRIREIDLDGARLHQIASLLEESVATFEDKIEGVYWSPLDITEFNSYRNQIVKALVNLPHLQRI